MTCDLTLATETDFLANYSVALFVNASRDSWDDNLAGNSLDFEYFFHNK